MPLMDQKNVQKQANIDSNQGSFGIFFRNRGMQYCNAILYFHMQ